MFHSGQHPTLGFWRRTLAAAGAALVLALTVLAASPVAHGWMHFDHEPASHEDGCAVVLFAGGLTVPIPSIDVPPPAPTLQASAPAPAVEIFLMTPRYLRQPERGPPLG